MKIHWLHCCHASFNSNLTQAWAKFNHQNGTKWMDPKPSWSEARHTQNALPKSFGAQRFRRKKNSHPAIKLAMFFSKKVEVPLTFKMHPKWCPLLPKQVYQSTFFLALDAHDWWPKQIVSAFFRPGDCLFSDSIWNSCEKDLRNRQKKGLYVCNMHNITYLISYSNRETYI